ncbi:hypothetical protein PROFUN_12171 [Planoprotostelium fungivorum]|uniref:Uncharacterized protein n=1 Tax=Planoprotostelium fungivorum TaxID=1890364 RepID=A0A2P6N8F4_9EUKA|nr:hypothetical protein PROFUN_12171 [Planoprotostelium fungivorum]
MALHIDGGSGWVAVPDEFSNSTAFKLFRRNLKVHATGTSRIHGSTEFVAEGLDRQDSIIETKGRDQQSLNKTLTLRHWDRGKGERRLITQHSTQFWVESSS